MPDWRFMLVQRGGRFRESVLSEFFNTQTIGNTGEALVREGIQNSIDARISREEPVRVRIFLSGKETSVEVDLLEVFWKSLNPHLKACGLAPPSSGETLNYLTFEDFNTTGLEGDVTQWQMDDSLTNPFFAYCRAEGWSQKDQGGGRWGVGKFAFPRASRYRTHFALTVRESDGKRMAVGQTLLKYHNLGHEETYVPDGWFGEFEDTLGLPIVDRDFLEEFSAWFFLERTESQTGLSVVVPFVDEEVTFQSLVAGVVSQFFMPILRGDLVVDLQNDADEPTLINADSLRTQEFVDFLDDQTLSAIRQASWAVIQELPTVTLRMSGRSPNWEDVVLDDPAEARKIHQDETRYLVKVVCEVIRLGQYEKTGEFFVVLERSDTPQRPVFVRQMLRVSEVPSRSFPSFSTLVYIPDGPLGDMLGDAENPAHTNWFHGAKNFKGVYRYGKPTIDFVRGAPRGIVRAIVGDEELGRDMGLLADVFNIPKQPSIPSTQGKTKGKERGEDGVADEIDVPPPKQSAYVIRTGGEGEVLVTGNNTTTPITELVLNFAYDSRVGNPLKKYSKFDFELNKGRLKVEVDGCEITNCLENQLRLEIVDTEFHVNISGFDPKRDVLVSARASRTQEESDG